MANVWDVSIEDSFVGSTFVVCEFSNIFPTYLYGLPLEHDIDFTIDLEPSTKPISVPPDPITPMSLRSPTFIFRVS